MTSVRKVKRSIAADVIEKKYKELGPITWHESSVGVLFVMVVLLWFFRNPGFTKGWPSYITNLYVLRFQLFRRGRVK